MRAQAQRGGLDNMKRVKKPIENQLNRVVELLSQKEITRRKFLAFLAAGGVTMLTAACSNSMSSISSTLFSPTTSAQNTTSSAGTATGLTTTTTSTTAATTSSTTAATSAVPTTSTVSTLTTTSISPTTTATSTTTTTTPSLSTTVGLTYKSEAAYGGYTLFAPNFSKTTYLIDIDGKLVHSWASSYIPGQSVYLLDGGTLLRSVHLSDIGGGPTGGGVQKIGWDGTLIWDFKYMGTSYVPHHDIKPLPNGNVLLICWEFKTQAEAIAAGRKTALLSESKLWPEKIVEIQPVGSTEGTVVWEWHLWDHLIQEADSSKQNYGVVAAHPELMDINFALGGKADWIHVNAIDYNPKLDQIVLSCHEQSELWVIDHSTTTAQAAGHSGGSSGMGGDLLYRWGNPRGYEAGTTSDQKLFAPHNTAWIESGLPGEGDILIFNNGNSRPGGNYSSVDEITTPVTTQRVYTRNAGSAYGPALQTWIYKAKNPTDFFADKISSAQRLANGNTLVCHGPQGIFFEVTAAGEIVWRYVNPVTDTGITTQGQTIPTGTAGDTRSATFRAQRFAAGSTALKGLDLTPGKLLELTS